jgi:hypothetical protein
MNGAHPNVSVEAGMGDIFVYHVFFSGLFCLHHARYLLFFSILEIIGSLIH